VTREASRRLEPELDLVDLAAEFRDDATESRFPFIHIPGDAAGARHCMKRAFIAVFLIGISQPVVAQSIFDGFGQADRPSRCASPEFMAWRLAISRQIREHTPAQLNLGRGRVTVDFRVDRAGRVSNVSFSKYSSNAHALVIASVITSLKLAPSPSPHAECREFYFRQSFYFADR
jgi:hypothetical protein